MELTNSITLIEECLSDMNKWMSFNRLKLNKDKTQLLYLFSKYNPQQSLPPLCFGTDIIKPSPYARIKYTTIFDTTMSMLPHVNNVCTCAFYHLCTISRMRKYLSMQTTEILIQTFVTSKLDHCNSLLYKVPKNVIKKLQSVQNVTARLTTRSRKCHHITPIPLNPHWLPFSERIKFKILLLTFQALYQQSPTYIQDLITRYLPSRSLRSSSTLSLNPVSFNLKTYGSRASSVSVPELWNNLPDDIRSCENPSLFKHKLKTYLFTNFYFSH